MNEPLTTRDAFEGLNDVGGPKRIHVKAWGRDVFLLDPTAAIREEWEGFIKKHEGSSVAPWRAKVAQLLVCDESGKRIFTEADMEFLSGRDASAMTEIFTAGTKLLAITDEEIETLSGN